MESLIFTGVKYAELLGKPLTKSVYRQLPVRDDYLYELVNDDYAWSVILHGKINWCPSGCDAESLCECENTCNNRPRCRQLRRHQHVLMGADGSIFQGFLYAATQEYDEFLIKESAFQYYELSQNEQSTLKTALQAYKNEAFASGWFDHSHDERERRRLENDGRRKRLVQVEKELQVRDLNARIEFQQWVNRTLDALPVILLRG